MTVYRLFLPVSLRMTTGRRYYDGENTMVRWWKHDDTMMKTRWYDDENTMVRWWKRDDTMMKTRWYHRVFTIVTSYHRTFTIVPSYFHHRTIVFSSSCHRTIVLSPSYHRASRFRANQKNTYVQTEHRTLEHGSLSAVMAHSKNFIKRYLHK